MKLLHVYVVGFALHAGLVLAADPPAIRLPELAAPPAPMPAADAVQTIAADELYVFDADVECFIRTSPAGVLTVTKEQGPIRIRGKFAGGNGRTETRQYKGPFVYIVEASHTGRADLFVIPKGVASDDAILTRALEANVGPRPPPGPGPTPPGPTPDPANTSPFPVPGFRVLIVYETGQTLTAGQHSAIYGKTVRDYLERKCVVGPDGRTKEYRIWDQNLDVSAESETWRAAIKLPRASVPWLYVGDGKVGFSGPVPGTPAELLAALKKVGGE